MKYSVRKLIQPAAVVIALLAGTVSSHATLITPTSYDMPNGSGTFRGGEYNYWDANYTGSGAKTTDGAMLTGGSGKLTDGVIATKSWEWTEAGIGYTEQNAEGTGPYVGWTWGEPAINFHFAGPVNIDNITFYVDNPLNDSYGKPRGGVTAPKSITIGANTYLVDKTPGAGPLAITLANLGLLGIEDLTTTITRDLSSPDSFWLFVSEITFDDGREPAPVPEPSSLILLGAGVVGVSLWRRRRKA